MDFLVKSVVAIAYRRRTLVVAAVLVALGLSAVGARRVSFDADVLSLLPHDGRVIPAFRRYLASFGSVDQLYVVFTAPPDHAVAEYAEAIDDWVDRLRQSPEIAQVDAGVADGTRNFAWLADRELLLLGGESLDTALHRLSPKGLAASVASRRELLALPSSQMADFIRQDPAGLTDIISDALGLDRARAQRQRREARLCQPGRPAPPGDGAAHPAALRHGFLPRARSTAARDRRRRSGRRGGDGQQDLDEPLPPLEVAFAGGHRIALETEAVVRRESILNTVGSLALILPLLYLAFRSLWLVVVGSLPSALSLLVVLGILGFTGATLSAAAAGSAAMLFGLGVDGVVLLYVAHTLAAEDGTGSDGMIHAITGPSVSMLLGMWTTAATFYGLTFVDFPSLQQLGLLIGHSMVICGILTLVLVPALLPRSVSPRRRRGLTMPRLAEWVARHRGVVLGVSALATVRAGRRRDGPADQPHARASAVGDRLGSTRGAAGADVRFAGRGLRRARGAWRARTAAADQRERWSRESRASCPTLGHAAADEAAAVAGRAE